MPSTVVPQSFNYSSLVLPCFSLAAGFSVVNHTKEKEEAG